MKVLMQAAERRDAGKQVNPVFPNRWSPRAMSGAPLAPDDLAALFEAARWAPSCFNEQPWRLVYALRDTPRWPEFLGLLTESNQIWARRAGALAVIASKETFTHGGKPNRTHAFDAGAAWMSLALAASLRGLVAHGMAGFDYERARQVVELPDGFAVQAMAALGHPGLIEELPEKLQPREVPSMRHPLEVTVMKDRFTQGDPS